MAEGFIKLHRCITENYLWHSEPFDRSHAWIDLLLLATHKDNCSRIRGIKIDVKPGQLAASTVWLASRWQWSRGKVERFLDELEMEQQIIQQKNNVSTLISIINWSLYQKTEQQIEQQTDSKRTANGQQTDTYKNDKNEKNEKKMQDPHATSEVAFAAPAVTGCVEPPPRTESKPRTAKQQPITFNRETVEIEFSTPEVKAQIVAQWSKLFPGVDLRGEAKRAKEWLVANPDKPKKNIHKFLTNWFGRAVRGFDNQQQETDDTNNNITGAE